MSHLTTADVLLIGLFAFPGLKILTWCWEKLAPYAWQLVFVEVEINRNLAYYITATHNPLFSFNKKLFQIRGGAKLSVERAVYAINKTLMLIESRNPTGNSVSYFLLLPRWASLLTLFPKFFTENGYEVGYKVQRFEGWSYESPYSNEISRDLQELVPEKETFSPIQYAKSFGHIELEKDLDNFLKSKSFYNEKGIPYRRGYFLPGPPGSGKSSYVKYLAQKYNIPLYTSDLSKTLFPRPKELGYDYMMFFLVEDFDSIFHGRKRVEESGITLLSNPNSAATIYSNNSGPASFEQLLNYMSGVDAWENVVWFFTANDVSKVDEAIGVPCTSAQFGKTTRPGRLDRALVFDFASPEQKRHICQRVLGEEPSAEDLENKVTTATYEEECRTKAVSRIFGQHPIST